MYSETSQTHLMQGFIVQHLLFVGEAREHIAFDAQPGTAIRGALYRAMIELFSPNNPVPGIPLDPVRALLAAQAADNARGQDLPRSFTVEPPPAYHVVNTGERLQFGISLLGKAIDLMPYVLRAAPAVGELGLGRGRGRFKLIRVDETTPLNDSRRVFMHHKRVVAPRLQVTHRRVLEEAEMRRSAQLTLRFVAPMRLVDQGKLVKAPRMGTLLRRLIERAQTLVEQYSSDPTQIAPPEQWKAEWQRMSALGDQIDAAGLMDDTTHWVEISSYSRIRQQASPISGFVGEARWQNVPPEVLIWLLWGQSLHVGKNAVKGDGFFRVL